MTASVGQALRKFFEQSARPVLFTGAGVSVRAGLPTWKGLMESLAEGVRSSDPLTTQQMYECVRNGDYTRAIDYFSLSHRMLDGDKHKLLKILLSDFDSTAIQPIAKLPFHCCLTTNFDRSILDAVSKEKGKTPLDYRYGDHSFKQAQWEENMFVARIHGAVEMPESMVLSDAQFRELLKSETYGDLLRAVFVHRNVLFVGFSFYDPAVRHIFDELNRRFGPAPPRAPHGPSPNKHRLRVSPASQSTEHRSRVLRSCGGPLGSLEWNSRLQLVGKPSDGHLRAGRSPFRINEEILGRLLRKDEK